MSQGDVVYNTDYATLKLKINVSSIYDESKEVCKISKNDRYTTGGAENIAILEYFNSQPPTKEKDVEKNDSTGDFGDIDSFNNE